MKKFGLVLTLGLTAASVFAQSTGTVVYTPTRSIKDQQISVRAWGSGSMVETDEVSYEGVYSIRVSTRNFFAGGLMTLDKKVNVSPQFADKNNLLQFQIRESDGTVTISGGGGAGGRGGDGEGRGGGGEGSLQASGGGVQGSTGQSDTVLRNIRLIVSTSDGKKSEIYVPFATSKKGDKKWSSLAVPLQAISGLDKTNKEITEIGISGDATTTLYIGEVRIVNDSTPITGGLNIGRTNLALGDELDLTAWGFGGSSVLKYSWDFDKADGIQDEASGSTITRKFRKPGKYTITVTITDQYGLKKPYTTSMEVTVNP